MRTLTSGVKSVHWLTDSQAESTVWLRESVLCLAATVRLSVVTLSVYILLFKDEEAQEDTDI